MSDYSLTTSEAKYEFFLSAKDLRKLPCARPHYWGCGQTRYYRRSDVLQAALAKYGERGLQAKLQRRAKREETQRRKQAAARIAEQRLGFKKNSGIVDLTQEANENQDASAPAAQVAQVDPKELKELRKQISRTLKQYVTWGFLDSKNEQNGAWCSAQLLRVTQAQYCTLIGRAKDPQLESLVKRGAWYSVTVPFETVMDSDEDIVRGDLGIDAENPLTVKYQPSTQTLSVRAFVQHRDTFGNYNFNY